MTSTAVPVAVSDANAKKRNTKCPYSMTVKFKISGLPLLLLDTPRMILN